MYKEVCAKTLGYKLSKICLLAHQIFKIMLIRSLRALIGIILKILDENFKLSQKEYENSHIIQS